MDLEYRFLYFNHMNLALKVSGIGPNGGSTVLAAVGGGGADGSGKGAGAGGGIHGVPPVLPSDPNLHCSMFKDALSAETMTMMDAMHAEFRYVCVVARAGTGAWACCSDDDAWSSDLISPHHPSVFQWLPLQRQPDRYFLSATRLCSCS